MAYIKKGFLHLATGKNIRLSGNGVGVLATLEIGEVFPMRIFGAGQPPTGEKKGTTVHNPHSFSVAELHEVLDFIIEECVIVKRNLREYGIDSPKLFNRLA